MATTSRHNELRNRVRHGFKRMAQLMKLWESEFDVLMTDIEELENFKKGEDDDKPS